ncbi:hypothetical protein THRCLA_05661 [Thraustotheca clavata]|uniref:Atg6 BARA domain-containing protein n=1 Tax=Thraustotheca clavata TaxID=74557 RepID=A0A1V9ZV68_9STRA|nr:hypothetical protein THRCLA_05661 [Thraustotheca clavata]
MTIYLALLQLIFLRLSAICSVPVYMSKNVVGLVILFVAFYGNMNLQTLTTFLIQNPVGGFPSMFYALCGPAQVASIVGIMTGTLIQIWFNPLVVSQSWLVMFFSCLNWIVVFVLEGFIFPYQNDNLPNVCGMATSTSCFKFSAIPHTYYLSVVISGGIVIVAIIVIILHSKYFKAELTVPSDNSALDYLNVPDLSTIATSTRNCVRINTDGLRAIDVGILLIKNMLHVSDNVMTRSSNVQYELIYRFTPRCLRRLFSEAVGSILVYEVQGNRITRKFHHLFLHEMDIGHMENIMLTKVSPSPVDLQQSRITALHKERRYGHAITTYVLNLIANVPVFLGLNIELFTSNQFNIPVSYLLQGSTTYDTSILGALNETLALSDLMYHSCNDALCANAFLPHANELWSIVGQTFVVIPNFDQPAFQKINQTVQVQHINNLSGWNKATAQFSIDGHDMAITCMVRRARFFAESEGPSTAIVDGLAYCSERTYDPKWVCENLVEVDTNTYVIQVSKGSANYLGVTKRSELYMNVGAIAELLDGVNGRSYLQTVLAIDEYQSGIIRAVAPWDVLPAGDCSTYDKDTKLGWLMQMEGQVTIVWICNSLMVTTSIILWIMTVYLVTLQYTFLWRSAICTVPVYMSKNIIGIVILGFAFWGNPNLQTLSTFIYQNPSFNMSFYAYCGPAQLASIVGIMTGTLIQMWFNPRVVTQTWILLFFSILNFSIVFILEAFIFPPQSTTNVNECHSTTSSNCFLFSAIDHLSNHSAIICCCVIGVGIFTVYAHGKYFKNEVDLPPCNSVLTYLKIDNIKVIATSPIGIVKNTFGKVTQVDEGILLVKSKIHASSNILTRTNNLQYGLVYRILPTMWLKRSSQHCTRCKHGSAGLEESYVNINSSVMGPSMSVKEGSLSYADVSSHVKKIQNLHAVAEGIATSTTTSSSAFCTECLHILVQMLEKNNEHARHEKRALAAFLTAQPKTKNIKPHPTQNHHQEQVQALVKEREKIYADLERLEDEMAELECSELMLWEEITGKISEKYLQREDRDLEIAKAVKMEQRTHSIRRINVASDAFYIWHKGSIGTINGFALGRLNHCDWNEINAAWGEATLLLQHIADALGVVFIGYRLVPMGNFSKVIRLQRPEMEYHLHGSDQDAFPESFFNLGMAAWLTCMSQLEEWVYRHDPTFRSPYKISGTEIGESSILFLRDDEAWTRATKNALTNLKWLLAWSSKLHLPVSNDNAKITILYEIRFDIMPNKVSPTSQNILNTNKIIVKNKERWCGYGLLLSLLYTIFATILAISTYVLNSIANVPFDLGLNIESFTSNQFNVPVYYLLQGSTTYNASIIGPINETLALRDVMYQSCKDASCASAFLPHANELWSIVGQTFVLIPNFDQPTFQKINQTVRVQHINNLSGWNKAASQFSIDGHDMAMTCMVRRARFYGENEDVTTAMVDGLAYCSERTYDPKWVCENLVGPDTNTYVIQVSKGIANFLGVTKRNQLYMNVEAKAKLLDGVNGPQTLETVLVNDEYQDGILRAIAPWDILPASDCSRYNKDTKLGWLLQLEGEITMIWTCDSLMVSTSLVLFFMVIYSVLLQYTFLWRSVVCTIPVYMSKNFIGIVILGYAFWGNRNLQTLATYIYRNPSLNQSFYALCGAAQLASIVGIMTGTLIQTWFNPRLVTQTWILITFSLINWTLVFVLEGFIFPAQSTNIANVCHFATSSNCITFSAIDRLRHVSAIICSGSVACGILAVYAHSKFVKDDYGTLHDNTVLYYLRVQNIEDIVTSSSGIVLNNKIDDGVLLIKNMVHVSSIALTHSNNLQYGLIYRILPTLWLRRYYSGIIGSVLIVHVHNQNISKKSSYKHLHEMDIDRIHGLTGYLS